MALCLLVLSDLTGLVAGFFPLVCDITFNLKTQAFI